jgi:hypothetical protein
MEPEGSLSHLQATAATTTTPPPPPSPSKGGQAKNLHTKSERRTELQSDLGLP